MKIESTSADTHLPISHETLMSTLQTLSDKYPFIGVTYIGTSVLGRGIPMVTLGKGERGTKAVMYVGAQSGTESVTTNVLLHFVEEYCKICRGGDSVFDINMQRLLEARNIYVIPTLNVDGADLVSRGAEGCILRDRLVSLNGSEDFSAWTFNARGVDLKKNFSAGLTDSEPETASLCSLLRFSEEITTILALHEDRVGLLCADETQKSLATSQLLAGLAGKAIEVGTDEGGLVSWCAKSLGRVAFDLGCPSHGVCEVYDGLREVLFTCPLLF